MKLAYYPGCVAQESGRELDMATRWVCRKLGIELVEFPTFSCCGSGFVDEANLTLNVALNARNLAIAERAGLDLLTVCSTCQGMLTLANVKMTEPALRVDLHRTRAADRASARVSEGQGWVLFGADPQERGQHRGVGGKFEREALVPGRAASRGIVPKDIDLGRDHLLRHQYTRSFGSHRV